MREAATMETVDLPSVLRNLRKQGIRAERIAYELDVSFAAVTSWMSGRRKPKKSTIRELERRYGVRIL